MRSISELSELCRIICATFVLKLWHKERLVELINALVSTTHRCSKALAAMCSCCAKSCRRVVGATNALEAPLVALITGVNVTLSEKGTWARICSAQILD
jgi:hypothetical protein